MLAGIIHTLVADLPDIDPVPEHTLQGTIGEGDATHRFAIGLCLHPGGDAHPREFECRGNGRADLQVDIEDRPDGQRLLRHDMELPVLDPVSHRHAALNRPGIV